MIGRLPLLGITFVGVVAFGCSAVVEGGREIDIRQQDDGCSPVSISVEPGEQVNLKVTNESGQDYEIEGTEGTELEELIIPAGRTRSVGYGVPDRAGTYKLKCYVPGGPSTIIELLADPSAAEANPATESAGLPAPTPDSSATEVVYVELFDYVIDPQRASVAAGRIQFIAENRSDSEVHEVAVLQVHEDGSMSNKGEIENVPPGAGGSLTVDLTPGEYELACLIAEGEFNSPADHYQEGMRIRFAVE